MPDESASPGPPASDPALAEARAEAAAAHRMRDRFLDALAHDLRTPLNAILGWVQLLATGRLPPDALRDGLAAIERNAQAQARLIDDLLDTSRVLSGRFTLDPAPVDVAEVIRAAVAEVRPAADAKGVTVADAIEGGPHAVNGDAARLRQVARHLLTNALRFTPPDGRIDIGVRETGPAVELAVRDTGEGIDPAVLPHLFDRSRPVEPSGGRTRGGLGLGLAVVRQLVEAHGGAVRADSPGRGRGATFTVTLPRRSDESGP
jgi:signal transduction histidine kinase